MTWRRVGGGHGGRCSLGGVGSGGVGGDSGEEPGQLDGQVLVEGGVGWVGGVANLLLERDAEAGTALGVGQPHGVEAAGVVVGGVIPEALEGVEERLGEEGGLVVVRDQRAEGAEEVGLAQHERLVGVWAAACAGAAGVAIMAVRSFGHGWGDPVGSLWEGTSGGEGRR